jgi:SHS2 domain-containing protein
MPTRKPHWEHFPHAADVGIRGLGATPAQAFAQAALALTAIVTEPSRIHALEVLTVECQAGDLESLLFEWIDALGYEMSARRMLFVRFEPSIDRGRLTARIWGEPVDRERHQPAVEVKGPTYTELRVVHDPRRNEWRAQCVVDV